MSAPAGTPELGGAPHFLTAFWKSAGESKCVRVSPRQLGIIDIKTDTQQIVELQHMQKIIHNLDLKG